MALVQRRRFESVLLVKRLGLVALRMCDQRSQAADVSGLDGS
jgi:hypothetical protein